MAGAEEVIKRLGSAPWDHRAAFEDPKVPADSTAFDGLPLSIFLDGVRHGLAKHLDDAQLECVTTRADDSLFIVAGPGSGKTTVIALRVLRLVFVDLFDPAAIIATTFTNRAADELRSRILGWSATLRSYLAEQGQLPGALESLDINRIVTGTLDALAEETLRAFRPAGQERPVVLEQFQADGLMTHRALFRNGRFRSQSLKQLYAMLKGTAWGLDFAGIRAFSSAIRDRMIHDQIDMAAFEAGEAAQYRGVTRVCELLADYESALEEELALDFAGLEQRFLDAVKAGWLADFAEPIRAIFVDEYQDTNYVQECIYFSLVERAPRRPTLTVVGDDDQALYRFRGATVELFQDYEGRLRSSISVDPRTIYLSSNYRSTSNIVEFCDTYAKLDITYAASRIRSKPDLSALRDPSTYENCPVLGVFRPTIDDVTEVLASILDDVVNGAGFQIPGTSMTIQRAPGGTAADCSLLCGSPREYSQSGIPRLPLLLRDALSRLATPIPIFNPRGTAFHAIPEVEILGGLLLESLDPGSNLQESIPSLPREARTRLAEWRDRATKYVAGNPPPHRPRTLGAFVRDWQRRRASDGSAWPNEAPVSELLYKLATWIPALSADVEGLVYLEAFGRTVVGASRVVEPFVLSNPKYADGRIRSLIREVFAPIAIGGIDLDEDLFETLPGDRLGVLSIHQAKGLEFPLVIVDIGCHYRDNRASPALRFPNKPSEAANLEDFLRPYSGLEAPTRSALDRTFDDIVRQYFVAFSRAKEVLILAGLSSDDEDGPLRRIKNVAAGWTRNPSLGSRWDHLPHMVYV